MRNEAVEFYDSLAEVYHLIFEDWDASIRRQAKVVDGLLGAQLGDSSLLVLDCACGIGTQAIGLAQCGHRVTGSDVSERAVERAQREAERRRLPIRFLVSDMTELKEIAESEFDAVVAFDNALPHLERNDLEAAVRAMRSKLRDGGLVMASIRNYDRLIRERPAIEGPAFHGAEGERRIVHQVWEWMDEERYRVHLYITAQEGDLWHAHHFAGAYRAVLRSEVTSALEKAEFEDVRWLMPEESGLYIPLVMARAHRR
jgi:SAM-dependent methyltransferase